MAITLEALSADIKDALKADAGPAGKQAVCAIVSKALLDKDFVAVIVKQAAVRRKFHNPAEGI